MLRIMSALATAAAAAALVCVTAGAASAHRATLDAGLSTLYSGPDDGSAVDMMVCGQLQQGGGCFAFPQLTGFQSACALVEGTPSQHGDIVKRDIYILDRRTTPGDPLQLFVYQRTDTITPTNDTVSITLANQIALGIRGAPKAKCWLAANDTFLYAASSRDRPAVSIAKDTLAVTKIGKFSPAEHVKAITADDRGYVTLTFETASFEFDPTGKEFGFGGGHEVIANTRNSIRPNQ